MSTSCVQCGLELTVDLSQTTTEIICSGCRQRYAPIEQTITFVANNASDTVTFAPTNSANNHDGPGDSIIGDYTILNEIARGGMGVVYRARQRSLNRIVALKMIRSTGAIDDQHVRRFQAEAETAGKLDHPGIVTVYETGAFNGQPFLSMALVEGASLSDHTKENLLEPEEAARIMRQVAEAVACAHENGVVHRDLKPQNVLLDSDMNPRVTDFGLAKNVLEKTELTATGQILGTPAYMSPEQATGSSAREASDIWSLGATLYCLLTGRPPFQSATTVETLRQIVETDPVAPRRMNPAIPKDLETICLKCLQKESSARYESAEAIALDLQRFLNHEPIHARRTSLLSKAWLWCRRNPRVAIAVVVVLLVLACSVGAFAVVQRVHDSQIAQQQTQSDDQRAADLVEGILSAPAAGVPFAAENLLPLKNFAVPKLKARLEDTKLSEQKRSHAAIALALLGEWNTEYLVKRLESANVDEYDVIIQELPKAKSESLAQIKIQKDAADQSKRWPYKARLAMAAIQLGDASIAEDMCGHRPDLTQRAVFIDEGTRCHAAPEKIFASVRKTTSDDYRSATFCIIGGIPKNSLNAADLRAWIDELSNRFQNDQSPHVHSCAKWALLQWKEELPSIIAPHLSPDSEPRWFVNSVGMTMHKIPAGKLQKLSSAVFATDRLKINPSYMGAGNDLELNAPIYVAAGEVTLRQFREFLNDAEYRKQNKLLLSSGSGAWDEVNPRFSTTLDHPVHEIDWKAAAAFCDWLSRKEGLTPAYWKESTNARYSRSKWKFAEKADGYRLPTSEEWRFAARGGTTTRFHFGSDESLLNRYVAFRSRSASFEGAVQPNPFGLFHMVGNMWERTCEKDCNAERMHGGSYYHNEDYCRSYFVRPAQQAAAMYYDGFRVVRNANRLTDEERAQIESQFPAEDETKFDTNPTTEPVARQTKRDEQTVRFYFRETDGRTIVTESGSTDTVELRLAEQPKATVTFQLFVSDKSEAKLSQSKISFTRANWDQWQPVEITGVDDDDSDGDKIFSLLALREAISGEPRPTTYLKFIMGVNQDDE